MDKFADLLGQPPETKTTDDGQPKDTKDDT